MAIPSNPSSPRTPRGEASRERVLVAATRLFAERGFAPVTIRAIGEAAGLDNSSLYRHFASKSELAHVVVERSVAELANAMAAESASGEIEISPTLEGLVGSVSSAAIVLWDRPHIARLLLHLILGWRDEPTGFRVSIPAEGTSGPSAALFRAFRAAIATAVESGEVREIAWPETFVAVFSAMVLRPATRGSFLASQEPERGEDEARTAWRHEVETLVRERLRT